jgi:prepilin signal peptidase PulO-like enzyme (type II secretory pathway)
MELSAATIAFFVLSIPICVADARSLRIPNRLLLGSAFVVATAAVLEAFTGGISIAPADSGVLLWGREVPAALSRLLTEAGRAGGDAPYPGVGAFYDGAGAVHAGAGALYAGAVLATARMLSGGALGGADVKYGVLLGGVAGPVLAACALLVAAVSAGAYLMIRRSDIAPFAPFMAAGLLVSLLVVHGGARW